MANRSPILTNNRIKSAFEYYRREPELPCAIQKAPLADLCEKVVDCPHSTPVWTDHGTIVLRNQNIRNGRLDLSSPSFTDEAHYQQRIRRAEPKAGDLVITREAPMGEVCEIPSGVRCCLGQRMVLLRPDSKKCVGKYLLYALQSQEVRHEILVNEGTGSTVSNLRIPLLEKLPIPVFSLDEQRAIARILGTLDDKIELNRRKNHTLESIALAIFKSWFIDFDPVKAKASGQILSSLKPKIATLFPDAFEESVLGLIPKGWKACQLSEVIDINPTRKLTKGTNAPYLDMANMPTVGPSAQSWTTRDMGSGMKFVRGDTLVARITPCLENGKTALVDFLADDQVGWGSTEYIVLRPKEPITPRFAYILARTDSFRSFAIQQMTGSSGRQRVSAESLANYIIPAPALDSSLYKYFGSIVDPIFDSITSSTKEIRTLTELRNALLPKLISGEIRIRDAEKFVGATI